MGMYNANLHFINFEIIEIFDEFLEKCNEKINFFPTHTQKMSEIVVLSVQRWLQHNFFYIFSIPVKQHKNKSFIFLISLFILTYSSIYKN